jgi:hypothetical protein
MADCALKKKPTFYGTLVVEKNQDCLLFSGLGAEETETIPGPMS